MYYFLQLWVEIQLFQLGERQEWPVRISVVEDRMLVSGRGGRCNNNTLVAAKDLFSSTWLIHFENSAS